MKILLIEDYEPLRKTVSKELNSCGYAVDQTGDGSEGKWYAYTGKYDLIILDLMLPNVCGLEILRFLRDEGIKTYVLITSAKSTVEQKIDGLDLGADDYLVKPYSLEELKARVRSIIRRQYDKVSPVQTFGDLVIDTNKKKVFRAGKEIELSAREYSILEYLTSRQGHVVSRESILEHVYDFNAELSSNVIDVYIRYLRKKTEIDDLPRLIHTKRNLGYVFEASNQ